MKTTWINDDYENTHGRSPKGTGRWAFRAAAGDGNGSWTDLFGGEPAFFTGTFTAAKRAVKEASQVEARTIGAARELVIETLG